MEISFWRAAILTVHDYDPPEALHFKSDQILVSNYKRYPFELRDVLMKYDKYEDRAEVRIAANSASWLGMTFDYLIYISAIYGEEYFQKEGN